MWTITPQTERRGKESVEVLCRKLCFFPAKDKKTGDERFIRLKFLCLKVLFKHQLENVTHKITYSCRNGKNLFTYHWPNKEKTTYHSLEVLNKALAVRGKIADEICLAFVERMAAG
jgi:hypothetical protein